MFIILNIAAGVRTTAYARGLLEYASMFPMRLSLQCHNIIIILLCVMSEKFFFPSWSYCITSEYVQDGDAQFINVALCRTPI